MTETRRELLDALTAERFGPVVRQYAADDETRQSERRAALAADLDEAGEVAA